MSWRIVMISNRAKLDFKLNYMVVRQKEETTKIFLDEISLLILESTAISVTVSLLSQLIKKKIKVIFCDEKRNPISELISYYGSHDSSDKIRKQIKWSDNIKSLIWTEIVRQKLNNQKLTLRRLEKDEWKLLDKYINEIEINDETNREGHGAKVYFNAIFGKTFSRSQDNNINAALNYGYTVLLAAINREITALGYITQLGIFHDNMFNHFNLSSDLIEPLRYIVDEKIIKMNLTYFEKEEKLEILDILNKKVIIDGKNHFLNNAIGIYSKSVIEAIEEKDISKIKFIKNEL
ncbi:MAG: type II CRISPR-associated endonuclease Cas1 [Tissierellia bacterium]|nr:type II CRISPR-associated endonuclease Cas1 [Tissierellia bacterium]